MQFEYEKTIQYGEDKTEYVKISKEGISVGEFDGKKILKSLARLFRTLLKRHSKK